MAFRKFFPKQVVSSVPIVEQVETRINEPDGSVSVSVVDSDGVLDLPHYSTFQSEKLEKAGVSLNRVNPHVLDPDFSDISSDDVNKSVENVSEESAESSAE